jgi:hypothetical protein
LIPFYRVIIFIFATHVKRIEVNVLATEHHHKTNQNKDEMWKLFLGGNVWEFQFRTDAISGSALKV